MVLVILKELQHITAVYTLQSLRASGLPMIVKWLLGLATTL